MDRSALFAVFALPSAVAEYFDPLNFGFAEDGSSAQGRARSEAPRR